MEKRTFCWRYGGSNPGPFRCKRNALPLSHIPAVGGAVLRLLQQSFSANNLLFLSSPF